MVNKLKLIFHCTVLLTYVCAIIWQLTCLDFTSTKDERILDMHRYKEKYFTGWNFTLHIIYFALALSEDIYEYVVTKRWHHVSFCPVTYLKAHIFTMFMVPCTTFVTSMFWGLYYYDRELVYPVEADDIVPEWFNHILHSCVLIFVMLEFYFTGHHPEVSLQSVHLGLIVINVVYYTVFFYHYSTIGRFLYPMFDQFTWYQMVGFIVVIYFYCLVVSQAGIKVQSWIKTKYRKNKIESSNE